MSGGAAEASRDLERRPLLPVVLLVALCISALVQPRTANASDPQIIEEPGWTIGDWWEGETRITVVEKRGKEYVLARSQIGEKADSLVGRTRIYTPISGWTTKIEDSNGKVTYRGDDREWVRFPLKIGGRWSFFHRGTSADASRSENTYSFACEATRWETIEIKARQVRAVRIDCVQRPSGSNHTAWYAPEAKRVVRLTSSYPRGPGFELTAWNVESGTAPPIVSTPPPPTPRESQPPALSILLELNGPPDAQIRIREDRYALDAQGRLMVSLAPGTYVIEATKDGYLPARQSLTLQAGRTHVVQQMAMAKVVPPTITMLDPTPGAPIRSADVRIKVEIKSAYRLGALRVGKDGEQTEQTFTPRATAKLGEPWIVEAPIRLAEGDNRIRLEAVDEYGGKTQQRVTLVRQTVVATPAPVVATPVPTSPPAATRSASGIDTEAPKIVFSYPPDGAQIDREEVIVLGLVTDDVAVDRVLISVNGRLLAQSEGAAVSVKSHSIRTPVTLQPGTNVIEIMAVDKSGNASQSVRTVVRTGGVVSTVPPQIQHDRWAVVIGIGSYDNPAIPKLRYAGPDAEEIYKTLLGSAGFKKENVLLLTDKSERKPTLKNIRWALGTFLARAAKKDDTVFIFFAGHGAPETDQRGFERDGLAKYLIPRDADPDDLFSSALPMDDLQTIFGRIESERVVAFLDACYSGAAGGRTFAAKNTRGGNVDDLFLERLTRSRGRAIITASRPAEVSIELAELGHGIFTYYLIEGLKGAADLNRDGIVTLQELYEYLEQQVTRKSRSVGGNQHPVMKGELEGVVPLTKTSRH